MVALGDFNTKSSNWYKHDEAIYKGSKIDVITDPSMSYQTFYLTDPSKIFFQMTFFMRLSSAMTEIHLGLAIEARS